MDRFPQDAEARAEKLEQLIDARITATENHILIGQVAIVRAVAEQAAAQFGDRTLNCDADEAEALVRAAVVGKSALVGARIAEVVSHAIYAYVLPLAQQDLADIERRQQQSADDSRIEQATWHRVLA